MTDPIQRSIESVEAAIEKAREKKEYDRIVRLERKRDLLHSKQFKAHMRRVKALPR